MSKKTKAKKRAAKKSLTNKVTTRPRLKLTDLQKRVVDILHSMKKPGKLKAYNLAGYKLTGKAGSVEVNKLLKLPHVRAYYESLRKGATERAQRTSDEIVAELEKIAFSNIKNYLSIEDDEVYFKDFSEITNEQAAAVESIKVMKKIIKKEGDNDVEIQTIQFKLYNKPTALELLGKRFGLFPNKTELTGKDGGPIQFTVTVTKTYKKKK